MGDLQQMVAGNAERVAAADRCLSVSQSVFRQHGDTAASYLPGHPFAEVDFCVGQRFTSCSAAQARDLIAVLQEVLAAGEVR